MDSSLSAKVRDLTTGVRLTKRVLTAKRVISREHAKEVADLFGADVAAIGGDRRVINTDLPVVSPVYSILREVSVLVARWSIDYPESGVRLIRIDKIDGLLSQANVLRGELDTAINELIENWHEVVARAKNDLKRLFNEADYNVDLRRAFGFDISFPAIEPDRRLQRQYPELYAQEQKRIASKMEAAIVAASNSAADTFAELLAKLNAQLTGVKENGRPATIRPESLERIKEAVQYFKTVSLGDDEKLTEAVAKVEQLVNSGLDIKTLRSRSSYRANASKSVAELASTMTGLVIERRRKFDLEG